METETVEDTHRQLFLFISFPSARPIETEAETFIHTYDDR